MWERYKDAVSRIGKHHIVWRRVIDGEEHFTLTNKLNEGIKVMPPRNNAGYYIGRHSFKKIGGIDLSNS